jgi:hypothetical protein
VFDAEHGWKIQWKKRVHPPLPAAGMALWTLNLSLQGILRPQEKASGAAPSLEGSAAHALDQARWAVHVSWSGAFSCARATGKAQAKSGPVD